MRLNIIQFMGATLSLHCQLKWRRPDRDGDRERGGRGVREVGGGGVEQSLLSIGYLCVLFRF